MMVLRGFTLKFLPSPLGDALQLRTSFCPNRIHCPVVSHLKLCLTPSFSHLLTPLWIFTVFTICATEPTALAYFSVVPCVLLRSWADWKACSARIIFFSLVSPMPSVLAGAHRECSLNTSTWPYRGPGRCWSRSGWRPWGYSENTCRKGEF